MSHRTPRYIKVACVLTLVSLGLISWAIIHPVPLAVIAAMSIGQGIGTIGVVLFAIVALRDLKPIFKSRRTGPLMAPPSGRGTMPPESKPPESKPPESKPPESEPPESEPPESA